MKQYLSAFALEYDPEEGCDVPRLSARGEFYQAEKIVALAKKHGVPVIERPEIVPALALLDEGGFIPESLFRAVAIILSKLSLKR